MSYRMSGPMVCLFLAVGLTAGTCDDAGDCGCTLGDGNTLGEGLEGLSGREFVSVDVTENGEARSLVDGTTISMRFYEDGRLNVSAGCNSISGNCEIVDGILQMDEMMVTEMGCDQELHAQDDWLSDVLSVEPSITLDGDTLVMEAALEDGTAVRIELLDVEVASPDLSLTGTLWTVDTLIDEIVAGNSNWENPATVTFTTDGTVSFFDGCNDNAGTYTVSGDTITFSDAFESTLTACMDETTNNLETHVLSVISGEVTYEIDQNRLTLMNGDIGLGCVGEE